jgi:DNA-binding transcriptional regulator GbsR (MarR family)
VTPRRKIDLHPVVRRFVGEAGRLTQSFGIGRVVGQIYAYLYFAPAPQNLADLQEALGISKGAASMGVRLLEQWDAVRKVWVRGDRKDYYEANIWFGKILKNALVDTVAVKMSAYTTFLDEVAGELAPDKDAAPDGDGEAAFVRERLEHLRVFSRKARAAWTNPFLQRLLR